MMRRHRSERGGVPLYRADEGVSERFDGYIESFHPVRRERSSSPNL